MGFIQYPSNRPASGDNDNALLRKLLSSALDSGQIDQASFDRLTEILARLDATGADIALIFNLLQGGVPIRDGATTETARVEDGHLSTLSVLLEYEVSHSGEYNGKSAAQFHIMGRRAGFNSTTILQDVGEFLAAATNVFPVLAGTEALEVVSSAAADDPSSTGTHSVRIAYLDTNDDMAFLDVVLDGVTPVSLGAVRMKFVYWMEALTGGTGEVSAGNIDLRVVAGAVVQERITAQTNRSLSCRFIVPRNYEGFVTSWGASSINTDQDVRLRATVNSVDRSLTTRYNFQDMVLLNAGASQSGDVPWLRYPALTKIKASTFPGATGATNRLEVGFTILLVHI